MLDRISGKWLQPLFVFMVPSFKSAFWQQPWDMLSQFGFDNPTYIFPFRWFSLPETLWVAHNGFCVTSLADFSKKLFWGSRSLLTGPNLFQRYTFVFVTRMKNVLSRGRNLTVLVCVFFFPLGPARYFYPIWAGSESLTSTSVLCLFLFVPLVVDNYSFSKVLSICHIFGGSRAFV